MRAECTAIGVISFSNWSVPSWRRITKYSSLRKRPRGLSTGGRYGAIASASCPSCSAPGVHAGAHPIDSACRHGRGIRGHEALAPAGIAQGPTQLALGPGVGGPAGPGAHVHGVLACNDPGEPGGDVA